MSFIVFSAFFPIIMGGTITAALKASKRISNWILKAFGDYRIRERKQHGVYFNGREKMLLEPSFLPKIDLESSLTDISPVMGDERDKFWL